MGIVLRVLGNGVIGGVLSLLVGPIIAVLILVAILAVRYASSSAKHAADDVTPFAAVAFVLGVIGAVLMRTSIVVGS